MLQQWPTSIGDQLNRALLNLSRAHPKKGNEFRTPRLDKQLLFESDPTEANFVEQALEEEGYIRIHSAADISQMRCSITPAGWAQVAKIEADQPSTLKPVFVAMWFGDDSARADMDDLYARSIKPAVEEAGYRVTRADIEPHNDFIMNQVLGDIRVAPFVVADFTGNRNGVYFEAGFARGLGTTVIHTCKRTEFENAHFDTQQLNHLLWDEPSNLREKLLQHIRGSVGEGPYIGQERG